MAVMLLLVTCKTTLTGSKTLCYTYQRGVEKFGQSRNPHKVETVGSNPASATTSLGLGNPKVLLLNHQIQPDETKAIIVTSDCRKLELNR